MRKVLAILLIMSAFSCTKSELFIPNAPVKETKMMFRIESVDFDGKTLYSPIVTKTVLDS